MADYNSNGKDKIMGFFEVPVRNSYRGTTRTFPLTGSLDSGAPARGDVTLVLDFVEGESREPDEACGHPEGESTGPVVNIRVNVDAVKNL